MAISTPSLTTISASAPAKRAPVRALLAANVVSLIGNMLTVVALPWFVLQTTGSAAKTGLTGFAAALPLFIVGIFGGALVDRLGYKRSSVIADVVSGLGIALVPLLYHTVGLAFWQLLACTLLGNLLAVPGITARRAMLPELAALAKWRLEQISAAFEAVQYAALLLGPPVAGLLIAVIGASNVLWIDAASFAISAATIALAIPAVAAGTPQAASGRYRDALLAGLRFLRDDRLLLTLALILAVSNMLGNPLFGIALPVFAKETYGSAAAFGVIIAAIGGGQIVGAALYGAFGHRLPRRALWIAAFIVTPVPWFVLVLTSSLPVIVAAMACCGLFAGPGNPMLVTIRHERIPQPLRGRVFSTFSAISGIAQPLGLAFGGFAIEAIGMRGMIVAIAVTMIALGLAMFFLPALHDMNRRPAHEPA